MGYDMYMVEVADAEVAVYDAARERFTASAGARDDGTGSQALVDTAFAEMQAAQPYYFRLNIWGMNATQVLMAQCDMAYPSAPDGPWPAEATEDELAVYKRTGLHERPGIALHKLGSNDGWVVTPIECLGALAQWKKWCAGYGVEVTFIPDGEDGEPATWWPEWLSWLARSAERGGFEVW